MVFPTLPRRHQEAALKLRQSEWNQRGSMLSQEACLLVAELDTHPSEYLLPLRKRTVLAISAGKSCPRLGHTGARGANSVGGGKDRGQIAQKTVDTGIQPSHNLTGLLVVSSHSAEDSEQITYRVLPVPCHHTDRVGPMKLWSGDVDVVVHFRAPIQIQC